MYTKSTRHGQASGFKPMIEEYQVNARRQKMGMEVIEIYALNYGFNYALIAGEASKTNDENYIDEVGQLLINAKRSYQLNQFDSVYYYYNEASTFIRRKDGMN